MTTKKDASQTGGFLVLPRMDKLVNIFRDGGWSMIFVVLFGLVALGTAAFYAGRPDEKHEAFLKWMSRATLWSILAGMCSDFATTFNYACQLEDWNRRSQIVIEGAPSRSARASSGSCSSRWSRSSPGSAGGGSTRGGPEESDSADTTRLSAVRVA